MSASIHDTEIYKVSAMAVERTIHADGQSYIDVTFKTVDGVEFYITAYSNKNQPIAVSGVRVKQEAGA